MDERSARGINDWIVKRNFIRGSERERERERERREQQQKKEPAKKIT